MASSSRSPTPPTLLPGCYSWLHSLRAGSIVGSHASGRVADKQSEAAHTSWLHGSHKTQTREPDCRLLVATQYIFGLEDFSVLPKNTMLWTQPVLEPTPLDLMSNTSPLHSNTPLHTPLQHSNHRATKMS